MQYGFAVCLFLFVFYWGGGMLVYVNSFLLLNNPVCYTFEKIKPGNWPDDVVVWFLLLLVSLNTNVTSSTTILVAPFIPLNDAGPDILTTTV